VTRPRMGLGVGVGFIPPCLQRKNRLARVLSLRLPGWAHKWHQPRGQGDQAFAERVRASGAGHLWAAVTLEEKERNPGKLAEKLLVASWLLGRERESVAK